MPIDFKISRIIEDTFGIYVLVRMYDGVEAVGPEPNPDPIALRTIPIINVTRYRRSSVIQTIEYTFAPSTPLSEMVKTIAQETSTKGALISSQETERTGPGNAAPIVDQHIR